MKRECKRHVVFYDLAKGCEDCNAQRREDMQPVKAEPVTILDFETRLSVFEAWRDAGYIDQGIHQKLRLDLLQVAGFGSAQWAEPDADEHDIDD